MSDPLSKSALSDSSWNLWGQSAKSDISLGDRIKLRLGGRDMAWLSRQTGIPTSTLSDYAAKGKTPRADKAVLIARALDTSVEWLFGGIEQAPAPLIDVADVDWVMLPDLDLLQFGAEGRPVPRGEVPIRRPWLRTVDAPIASLFLTSLPMQVGELIREGETILCRDAETDLVDGRLYIFMREGNPLVRRVAVDRGGYTLIGLDPFIPPLKLDRRQPEPHPDDALIPVARILGRFGLQTM